MDDYANAVICLEEQVDRAVNEALSHLSVEEVVKELKRIAQGWADSQ